MSPRILTLVKVLTVTGFLLLLCSTYYLRSEVVRLNEIRFRADNAMAQHNLEQHKLSHDDRAAEYAASLKHFAIEEKYYRDMLDMFQNDYDAYVERIKDKYRPPSVPRKPQPPTPPEVEDELYGINAEFRTQKYNYFRKLGALNWVACGAALVLVGGLLTLLMFDEQGHRLVYLAVLLMSFVFMIGPSFHSIVSAVIGFLESPPIY